MEFNEPKYTEQKLFNEANYVLQHIEVTQINAKLSRLAMEQALLTKEWNELQNRRYHIQSNLEGL